MQITLSTPPNSPLASHLAQPVKVSVVHPVDSAALLQGHKTVEIQHNGAVYRLQATKLGKLILTK